MKRTTIWVGLLLLALAALGGLAWWWQGRAPEVQYRTAAVEKGPVRATVSAAGTVTAVAQIQVGSQVSGQIKEVLVDFNSEVREGQLLARLDPQSFEQRVRQAEADVEAARAAVLNAQAAALAAEANVARATVDLRQAERDLERNRGLVGEGFISPAELERTQSTVNGLREALKVAQAQRDVAHAQVRSAEATVRQRQAQLAQAQVDLGRTEIRSPVNGIVIKRSIELGQTVAASLQAPELFVIARNLDDMQVEVPVDEADIGRVQPDQDAVFTVDAFPGRRFLGKVRQVRKASTNTQNVITYTVVVAFDNKGGRLLPGMTASVRIVTQEREDVLKVPNAALRVRLPGAEEAVAPTAPRGVGAARAGDKGRIYLVAQGNGAQPYPVEVEVGISDGSMTEVRAPELRAGQQVVVSVQSPPNARTARPSGPRFGL
ncbi:MAG TPA: efflux RND transporter periplasmic adaptor subunit [Burkholderiaceae bacterium]|nr:efflux RND transporter periplasmic adaptor subunit [Burkholderiaceae bacterium]